MKNQKVLSLDGNIIVVTKHGTDDYDIYFEGDDDSVRGTMLDVVKAFAEWQWSVLDTPAVSFDFDETDQEISNPWMDTSARFDLTDIEAYEKYGADNLLRFISDACDLLRPDETEV